MSYAGPGAVARARLALEIVRERLASDRRRDDRDPLRADRRRRCAQGRRTPARRRIRARSASASSARTDSMAEAVRVGNEVETLYTNGPGRRRRRAEVGAAGRRRGLDPAAAASRPADRAAIEVA